MDAIKIKVKRLTESAKLPEKAHPTDAGADLFYTYVEIDANNNVVYHTGIAIEIPKGYVGLLFPRSSVAKKDLTLANCVGVVDSNYRGEVILKYRAVFRGIDLCLERKKAIIYNRSNLSSLSKIYGEGERVGQIIVIPYPETEYEEVKELTETDRGEGGFGSTGN